jgi:hypothetical protein
MWIYYISCIIMLPEHDIAKVNCSPSGIFNRGYLQVELKHDLSAMLKYYVDCCISWLVSCGHSDSAAIS